MKTELAPTLTWRMMHTTNAARKTRTSSALSWGEGRHRGGTYSRAISSNHYGRITYTVHHLHSQTTIATTCNSKISLHREHVPNLTRAARRIDTPSPPPLSPLNWLPRVHFLSVPNMTKTKVLPHTRLFLPGQKTHKNTIINRHARHTRVSRQGQAIHKCQHAPQHTMNLSRSDPRLTQRGRLTRVEHLSLELPII